MRENRTSGSEGRESETNRTSLPLFSPFACKLSCTLPRVLARGGEASCAFGARSQVVGPPHATRPCADDCTMGSPSVAGEW